MKLALLALALAHAAFSAAPDDAAAQRAAMVAQIRAGLVREGFPADARLDAVLGAMARIPREDFVPADQRGQAYAARPLPIGGGQTISDPFIIAYMTRQLDLRPGDRVLEIGTGSGYQAALLGALADQVYTIEIVPQLARRAAATLAAHGAGNVHVREGDGNSGWPDAAPFDAIIVTAGARRIPPALVAQLRPGGRMILPLGASSADEHMTLVRKDRNGRLHISACGWVFFVPFIGEAQQRDAAAARGHVPRGRCEGLLGGPGAAPGSGQR